MPAADEPRGTESGLGLGAQAALVLLAAAPFLACLAAGFVWDDWQRIANNPHLGWSAIPAFWTGDPAVLGGLSRGSMYNPLAWTTYAIEAALAPSRPPMLFHATNLLIHGLLGLGLYHLVRSASGTDARIAGLIALAVAWSPVLGETAGWVSARLDGLAALLLVVGAALAVRAQSLRAAALGGAVLALSLTSKESGAALVVLVPLLLLAWRRDRPAMSTTVTAGAVALLLLGARVMAGVGVEGGAAALRPEWLPAAWLELMRLAVAPIGAGTALRPLPLTPSGGAWLLFLGLVALGLWAARARNLAAVLGVLWIAAGALPNALAVTRYELLPDRYAAVALPGVALLLGAAVEAVKGRAGIVMAFAGVIAAAFVTLSSRQALRFADDVAFFSHEVERWPDEPQGWFFLGDVLAAQGQFGHADGALLKAAELAPDLPQVWLRLTTSRLEAGDPEGARRALDEGLRRLPEDPGLRALEQQLSR